MNVNNANAFFNASNSTITQDLGNLSWLLTNSYVIGSNVSAAPTLVLTNANGALRVTNAARTAGLDVRRGTNRLNAGLGEADRLLLTNTAGRFEFNGGTLGTRGGTTSNDLPFNVGANRVTPAIWDARAGGKMELSSTLNIGTNTSGNQMRLTSGGVFCG